MEKLQMPTIAHTVVLHFKNLVVGKDDAKIADLKDVAAAREHVKFTEGTNVSTTDNSEQQCVKRDSESYTLMIPNLESLLGDLIDGIDGLALAEVKRVQELVAKHVDDYARKLTDGLVARDENGNVTEITGFQVVTDEIASFALAAAEAFGRAKGAGKQTVPKEVRDAGVASFAEFLAESGVPEKGVQVMTAGAKSYFSPTTIAQLPPEALEKIRGRIDAWFDACEEADKQAYGLLHSRWVEKLNKALSPDELDMDIF